MLLDIIIPHYHEEWTVCAPMFHMLLAQKCVNKDDFRVTVVHNGERNKPISTDLFNEDCWLSLEKGPINIRQFHLQEPGVSKARNFGLDHAEADWVMFCDVDDCFTSIYSLASAFYILKSDMAKNFDLVWGPFYMSGANFIERTKSMQYNPVFIHNKYYRRSFLNEHGIRFPEDIHMSEDSAFNTIVKLEIGEHRIGAIQTDEPLYAWCRRAGSITMDFSKWLYNTEGHFDRNLFVINEHKKRGLKDWEHLVGRTITDAYAMLNRFDVPKPSEEFRKRLSDYYKEHEEEFNNLSKDILQQALDASDKDVGILEDNKKTRPELKEWIQKELIEYYK